MFCTSIPGSEEVSVPNLTCVRFGQEKGHGQRRVCTEPRLGNPVAPNIRGYAETVPHTAIARNPAPDAAPGRRLRQERESGSASTRAKPMEHAAMRSCTLHALREGVARSLPSRPPCPDRFLLKSSSRLSQHPATADIFWPMSSANALGPPVCPKVRKCYSRTLKRKNRETVQTSIRPHANSLIIGRYCSKKHTPSPHTNSLIIGTAKINTRHRNRTARDSG